MKFVDEYRDPAAVRKLLDKIRDLATGPHTLMELCGGQTHNIVKFGIDALLPEGIELIHGPGCPVCVTPVELIDTAVNIAARPGVIFCSFGDMLRVPGSHGSLLSARAAGADVRMVYSPLDAVRIAAANPARQVVFFAIGFETTAPANALAVLRAHAQELDNFSILCAQVLVPPAMEAILASPECRVQGFLAAGHVCTVSGYACYCRIADRHRVPIVVTGFEPLDLLDGIYRCIRQREQGEFRVENQYTRAVRENGNPAAREIVNRVFETTDQRWRGLGLIPRSGLRLRAAYRAFDAGLEFNIQPASSVEAPACISGRILQGLARPPECSAFGSACHPESPLGAPMVSSEGACAAYYRYRREPHAGYCGKEREP